MHGLDHKFAGVTRIRCHFVDGRVVCQVGTHGADCGNHDRIGDRIAFSQRIVEAPRVAKDPNFTSAFWRHFSREVGMKLRFSTTFHSQTDGKTERVNEVLKQYLRNLVSADQGDWADYVGQAEFSYNVAMHSATKELPFVVAYGVHSNLLT